DPGRVAELPVPAAKATPLGEEGPVVREFLDAVVAAWERIPVSDEDVPARIHRDPGRVGELPVPAARATPLGEEGPAVREFLDAVVVSDDDVPALIHGDSPRGIELPVPESEAAPFCQEDPAVVEFLDAPVVAVLVTDENVPVRIHRDPARV